jgi:hypothetical protein
MRQCWSGRSVEQKANGFLIAALGILAMHYGYSEIGGRPRSVEEPKLNVASTTVVTQANVVRSQAFDGDDI